VRYRNMNASSFGRVNPFGDFRLSIEDVLNLSHETVRHPLCY
jgi:hypothetical protein